MSTPYEIISKAHIGRVQGLLALDQSTFVSASKDMTVKIWDTSKKHFKPINAHPFTHEYFSWITSLGRLKENWISGSLDGYIVIRNPFGRVLKRIMYHPGYGLRGAYLFKYKNTCRINCIQEVSPVEGRNLFYTGSSNVIQLWDGDIGKVLKVYEASVAGWVYTIKMKGANLLVAVGAHLEHWDMTEERPKKTVVISTDQEVGFYKSDIASCEPLEADDHHIIATRFDKRLQLVNLVCQSIERTYQEHEGRVRSVINMSPHIIASGSDDRMIKLWDVRMGTSIDTLKGQNGRVCALLALNEITWISAAFVDDRAGFEADCSISFWDRRKLGASRAF